MTAIEVIQSALKSSQGMINGYLGDLSDEDIVVHPVPGANNIAWQIGHLTASEIDMVKEQIPAASYPEIPAALKVYSSSKSAATVASFMKKGEYLDWFNKVREATIAVVGTLNDADLDKPTVGSMKDYCPRLGEMFNLVSIHDMMHGGQFTVVRRLQKKPVLF